MSQTPTTPDRDVLIEGHDYDGILEYDNPMPSWWLAIFFITILWSVVYVAGISFGFINTYEDDLARQTARLEEVRAASVPAVPVDAEYLASFVGNPDTLAAGKSAFATYCVACHGPEGQGGIGPNLTDAYWIHGGSLMDIYNVANDGVIEKGMAAWGNTLSHENLVGVVLYIDSIRGTTPANPKDPEGTLYEAE